MADESKKQLFSRQWHRVADLKPRLRPHARFSRQSFGGQTWHMLYDPATGRSHRLTPAVYSFVARMDGDRSMEELWLRTSEQLGDDCPTQDECIQILSQLHGADALICHLPPDVAEMTGRGRKFRRRQTIAKIRNPLGIRIPLVDPDRFLEKTLPFVRPLISPLGFLFWLLIVGYGVLLAAMHWSAYTTDFADRVLAADNLIVLWLTFPFVKALHELGHGYTVKRWGGEVHEMGVMFLVFVPVPYVDASGSAEFREKWKRALVGSAGILTELPIAAIALMIWVNAEPGLLRAIAYNTVLISSISTLLFNANPLLRYDGYYVLADLAEMPNLAQRSNRYIGYLVQRYVFKGKKTVSPADRADERWKLAAYAVASFCYRMFVWAAIILLVASKFFTIGILLAIWAAWLMLIWPLLKHAAFVLNSPVLAGRRFRAIGLTGAAVGGFVLLASAVPLPLATMSEGVVWTPEKAEIRAGRSGVVRDVFVEARRPIGPGDPVVSIEDPIVIAEAKVARLRLRESEMKYLAALTDNPYAARLYREEADTLAKRVEDAEEKVRKLVVESGAAGQLIMSRSDDLPGKFVMRGDLIGYVKGEDGVVVKTVIPEHEIALLRARQRGATVRLASRPWEKHKASIVRIGPSATRQLPSMALSKDGGGKFSLDPTSSQSPRTLEDVYHVELKADGLDDAELIGGRVYVRVDLGAEPLAMQFFRRARQVFLERLDV